MVERAFVFVVVLVARVAAADSHAPVSPEEAKAWEQSLGLVQVAEPTLKPQLAGKICAAIVGCADGCQAFIELAAHEAYSDAAAFARIKAETSCHDGALRLLVADAIGKKSGAADRLQAAVLARWATFFEQVRGLLSPASRDTADCTLTALGLRGKPSHACAEIAVNRYTTATAPWGFADADRYVNRRANITATMPESVTAKVEDDGDGLKLKFADAAATFTFYGGAFTEAQLEAEARRGMERLAQSLHDAPVKVELAKVQLPLGAGVRVTAQLENARVNIAYTAVATCGGRAHAAFMKISQSLATWRVIDAWQQSFRQAGSCDAGQRKNQPTP